MIESTCGENEWVVIGLLWCIAPLLTAVVPVMTARYIANNTVRKILPHAKRKVDLQQQNTENKIKGFINMKIRTIHQDVSYFIQCGHS